MIETTDAGVLAMRLRYVSSVDGWDVGGARLGRAALLSTVIVALAAAAHILGHGSVPPAPVLVLLGAVTLPVTVVLAGRRVGGVGAVAVLGAGQVLMHGAFSALSACAPSGLATSVGHLGHAGHAATAVGDLGVSSCVHQDHSTAGGTGMVVLHAAATLLTAALVAGADRSLWGLLAKVVPTVGALVVLPVWRQALQPARRLAPPRALHLRRTPSWRGPPLARFDFSVRAT